jgi:hypothetical protein
VVIAETALHVSAAVNYAVAHDIAVQARSGGHSYGSYAVGGTDGTLVVDLSRMNDVRVHPEQDPESLWKAEVGPGARLGKVAEELYAQGKRAIGMYVFMIPALSNTDALISTRDLPGSRFRRTCNHWWLGTFVSTLGTHPGSVSFIEYRTGCTQ